MSGARQIAQDGKEGIAPDAVHGEQGYLSGMHWRVSQQEQAIGRELAPIYAELYHTRYYQTLRQLVGCQAKRLCAGIPHPRIVDLGCGPGSLARWLHRSMPDASVMGFDVSFDMLRAGHQAGAEVAFCSGVVEQLPFRSGSLDLVVGFSVLHHLPHLPRVWDEVARVLRPGGAFIFGEPHQTPFDQWPWLVKLTKSLFAPLYLPLWLRNHRRRRPQLEHHAQHLVTEVHRSLTISELLTSVRGAPLAMQWNAAAVLTPLFLPMMFDDDGLERGVFNLCWLVDTLFARWWPLLAAEVIVYGHRLP